MHYVYILKSLTFPDQIYIGYTQNIEKRLETHNKGGSFHTEKYRPWQISVYLTFAEKIIARDFEKYLKSHSGRAFATKRLIKLHN